MRESLEALKSEEQRYRAFLASVQACFANAANLTQGDFPPIYAIKCRIKSDEHILAKLDRKKRQGIVITPENVFSHVTDYCGVRVIHIHMGQFEDIHNLIQKQLDNNDWVLHEKPVANFWDPDLESTYEKLGLIPRKRDTLYSSVHYLVKPRADVPMVCEIQVRTLFEEIWGEVDHSLNYPIATANGHCKRQLRVLSKLVCSGSRLVDSIFESHNETVDHNLAHVSPVKKNKVTRKRS